MTDWYMFAATVFGDVVTIAAIYFTNKQTTEIYEKDKAYQNKKDNLVIIKPNLRFCCFADITDELIFYNVRDRVLVISSGEDGFDFYDDNKKWYENHRFFSIKNESENNISFLKIDVSSKLITRSDSIFENNYSNFINLLRSKEEVIFRIHSTTQRNKLWDELNNDRVVKSLFNCEIYYITNAEEQIYYQYEVEIEHVPERNENVVTDNAKISVIKDEYKILGEIILNTSEKASVFRNMQDKISTLTTRNRVQYIQREVGNAQAQGVMDTFFGNQQVSLNKESQKSEATDIPAPQKVGKVPNDKANRTSSNNPQKRQKLRKVRHI